MSTEASECSDWFCLDLQLGLHSRTIIQRLKQEVCLCPQSVSAAGLKVRGQHPNPRCCICASKQEVKARFNSSSIKPSGTINQNLWYQQNLLLLTQTVCLRRSFYSVVLIKPTATDI